MHSVRPTDHGRLPALRADHPIPPRRPGAEGLGLRQPAQLLPHDPSEPAVRGRCVIGRRGDWQCPSDPDDQVRQGVLNGLCGRTNGQLAFDFGDLGNEAELPDSEQLATWFLLYHATAEEIQAEVSLPSAMVGGKISDWLERIILPSFPRHEESLRDTAGPDDNGPEGYVVEVNRR